MALPCHESRLLASNRSRPTYVPAERTPNKAKRQGQRHVGTLSLWATGLYARGRRTCLFMVRISSNQTATPRTKRPANHTLKPLYITILKAATSVSLQVQVRGHRHLSPRARTPRFEHAVYPTRFANGNCCGACCTYQVCAAVRHVMLGTLLVYDGRCHVPPYPTPPTPM